jgi:hypothetical protein
MKIKVVYLLSLFLLSNRINSINKNNPNTPHQITYQGPSDIFILPRYIPSYNRKPVNRKLNR